jgi:RNA polymerase sigma factor (sigma-70 family)
LVERYLGLVHSAALRQVCDPHMSEDVAQVVFIILARKAGRLSARVNLAGWLYRATRLASMRVVRTEMRRLQREQAALVVESVAVQEETEYVWERIAPMLDEAMAQLSEKDRNAILFRFFLDKPLAEVGRALGSTEQAAKKRVARALEKLRAHFYRRGVMLPAVAVGSAMAANSVQAVPPALLGSVATTAALKGSTATTATLSLVKGTMKTMFWSKTKVSVVIAAAALMATFIPRTWSQPPGSLDTSFINPSVTAGPGGEAVYWLTLQPDGKIVVNGSFENLVTVNGQDYFYHGIARLNNDGSVDTSFFPYNPAFIAGNVFFDERVVQVAALQKDGKIVVGGAWAETNAVKRANISRLNPDGSLDATFDPGPGTDWQPGQLKTSYVTCVVIQDDGKILVGGTFAKMAGIKHVGLARLNPDGKLDTTFNPPTDGNVSSSSALAIQADGNILVFGGFSNRFLTRLHPDGTIDPTFHVDATFPASGFGPMALQKDGKILISSVRLNSDGSRDTNFLVKVIRVGSTVSYIPGSFAVQRDGKILIGGGFNQVNGVARTGIARLNSDGSVDRTFDPGSGLGPLIPKPFGPSLSVKSLVLQPDGKILLGGSFDTFNGVSRDRIIRVFGDPPLRFDSAALSRDTRFQTVITSLEDAPILIQSSTDLVQWSPLTMLTNATSGAVFTDVTTNASQRFYRALTR